MTDACSPSTVSELCRDTYGMDAVEAMRVVRLCRAMDEGSEMGRRYAIPGEPLPEPDPKTKKSPEPLPEMEWLPDREAFAGEVLRAIDVAGYTIPTQLELDPDVLWDLRGLLGAIGVYPEDTIPQPALDSLTMNEAGRPWKMTPSYFQPLLLRSGIAFVLAWLLGARPGDED